MLFSRVKISCFRAKAYLVFHCCLYNNCYKTAVFDTSIFAFLTSINWPANYLFKRNGDKKTCLSEAMHIVNQPSHYSQFQGYQDFVLFM